MKYLLWLIASFGALVLGYLFIRGLDAFVCRWQNADYDEDNHD